MDAHDVDAALPSVMSTPRYLRHVQSLLGIATLTTAVVCLSELAGTGCGTPNDDPSCTRGIDPAAQQCDFSAGDHCTVRDSTCVRWNESGCYCDQYYTCRPEPILDAGLIWMGGPVSPGRGHCGLGPLPPPEHRT